MSSSTPSRCLVLLAVSLGMVSVRDVHADARADDARAFFDSGHAAYDRGDYARAIEAWLRSYALSDQPTLLLFLGHAYRLRAGPGDCARASDMYTKFVAVAPSSPERAEAEDYIAVMQPCAPAGEEPPRSTMSRARKKQIAGVATAGVGVVLTATGVYYGHKASSLEDEVTRACSVPQPCRWDVYGPKDAEGREAVTKQYVFLGLGVAALVGGGVLYWLGTQETSRGVALTPRSDGGATLSWSGRW